MGEHRQSPYDTMYDHVQVPIPVRLIRLVRKRRCGQQSPKITADTVRLLMPSIMAW